MAKNVFITTNIFPPEIHPSGIMNSELARELNKKGYEVTVVTCYPSHPKGVLFPGWKRTYFSITHNNDYDVVRGWHPILKNNNFIARIVKMVGQSLSFLSAIKVFKKPIIIISDGPPIFGSIISTILAKIYGAKTVIVVHDFVLDVIISQNWIMKTLADKMKNIEVFSYNIANHIIVLSEGFRQIMIQENCIEESKVSIIPVWLDGHDIVPMDRHNAWRREMNISPEKFVVLYAGTIGLVSGAEVVLEAARLLKSFPDILFLFVGEGQIKDRLEVQGREMGLPNVRFLPFQPRERLSEVQATADLSLVTLAPGRGKTSVPSKVLGYMAAARPVIAAVDVACDTATTVRKAACGLVVSPGQGHDLAEAVLHFYHNPGQRESWGKAGRQYFLQHFERQVVIEKYLDLIEGLVPCNIYSFG